MHASMDWCMDGWIDLYVIVAGWVGGRMDRWMGDRNGGSLRQANSYSRLLCI